MTKQIVLGAAGFLGTHLVRALSERKDPIIAVSRRPTPAAASAKVSYRSLDLYGAARSDLEGLFAPGDVIYHLAWSSIPATAEANPSGDLSGNVGFVVRLLEAATAREARLVLCSSGGTVYGRTDAAEIDEEQPLRPIGIYGASKVAAEIYAGAFRNSRGADVRIARLANPYGPGQSLDRVQGALTRFASLALSGQPIEIWGDGEVVRDYLHVSDAVAGLLAIGSAEMDRLEPTATLNIGSGRGASLNELIKLLEASLERKLDVVYRSGRTIDLPRNVLSIKRARRQVGWSPILCLDEGVTRLLRELSPS